MALRKASEACPVPKDPASDHTRHGPYDNAVGDGSFWVGTREEPPAEDPGAKTPHVESGVALEGDIVVVTVWRAIGDREVEHQVWTPALMKRALERATGR